MAIDLRTLILLLGITHFFQVIIFYHQYRVNKLYEGPGWWLLWSVTEMTGFGAMLFRDVPGLFHISIFIQNVCIVGGTLFIYMGVSRFLGQSARLQRVLGVFFIYVAALTVVVFIYDNLQLRSVLINSALAVFSLFAVISLWSNNLKTIRATVYFNMAILATQTAVFGTRGILLAWGRPVDAFFVPTLFNLIPFIDALLVSQLLTYGFIIMLNERLMHDMREAMERFETIFETSPDAVVISSVAEGTIVAVNAAFAALSGYTRAECVGKSTTDLHIYRDPDDRKRILEKLQASGSCINEEVLFQLKDGHTITGLVSAKLFLLNHTPHIISITRDVTERKQAEDAIRKLNRELDQRVRERTMQVDAANKELEDFTYAVSHDLRSPMRAIAGFSSLVLEEEQHLSGDSRHLLERISSNTLQMGKLIDGLLHFTQLGRTELFKVELDMTSLVAHCIEQVQQHYPEQVLVFSAGQLPSARGDYALVQQAVQQLLSNAVKFSAEHRRPEVSITGYRDGKENVYCIADNGIGFNMQYADKLFGVFNRLHGEARYEGTGVGLAMVHRIINKHGGRIWAEGIPGAGARFYFTLPPYLSLQEATYKHGESTNEGEPWNLTR